MSWVYYRFLSALLVILLLPGCIGNYNTHMRKFPAFRMSATCRSVDNELDVMVEELSSARCQEYFGFDVPSYGYYPLMVEFVNYSTDAYVLRPSYIDLDYVSGKKIAQEMHYDTTLHMQWMTPAALLFCWPLIPFVVVPSGFWMRDHNEHLTRTIRRHGLSRRETLVVNPYETVRKFIFVEEESFKKTFTLSLFNTTQHTRSRYVINTRKKQAIRAQ